MTHPPDVLIAGAGIIGLSLALELRGQGATVTVLDRSHALGAASIAAAGMLAAEDPHNLPALFPLARHSLSLYPAFLRNIEALSGLSVPFQTSTTVQHTPGDSALGHTAPGRTIRRLAEHSLDPRQLAAALLAAARAASVRILEHTPISSSKSSAAAVEVYTESGEHMQASHFVQTTGAWSLIGDHNQPVTQQTPVSPRKGQMLRVAMPAGAPLLEVHRAEHIYVVPRTVGPQAGTALIGATVEDAGFDTSTDPAHLQELRAAAAGLGDETAFAASAPLVEAWAGLRPFTPDALPLLGRLGERVWIATGHFRNGVLLAPGTARLLADLIVGRPAALNLAAFAPARFRPASEDF